MATALGLSRGKASGCSAVSADRVQPLSAPEDSSADASPEQSPRESVFLPQRLAEMSASRTSPPTRYCRWSLAPNPCSPRPSALWQGGLRPLSPGTVQEFDLRQPLRDHGGEDQAKEDAADEHVVIVILQDVKLFGRVDTSLVNVQTIRHDLEGRGSERPVRKALVARHSRRLGSERRQAPQSFSQEGSRQQVSHGAAVDG